MLTVKPRGPVAGRTQNRVDPEQIREVLRPVLEAIHSAATGWTVAVCSRERALLGGLALLLEDCRFAEGSIAELLAQPLPTERRLLLICGDRLEDGGVDVLLEQLRLSHGGRCHSVVILPATIAQERLECIWRSGPDAIVCREACGDGQLLRSILHVLQGHGSVDPGLRRRLQQASEAPPVLNEREQQLLIAVARGHDSRTIASLQQVRSDSIRRNLSALYRKVGVKNQRGLIAWGLEQGLLRPPDLLVSPRPQLHGSGHSRHRQPAADH